MKKVNIKKALIDSAALGAGAIGANFLSAKLPIENAMVKNAAPIVVGIFLSSSKGVLSQVGAGMVAAGVSRVATSYIPGLAGVDIDNVLAGIEDSVLAGPGKQSTPGTL